MRGRRPNCQENSSSDIFETLHEGLTVSLIATPRSKLMTCASDEAVSAVVERNAEHFDFVPVIDRKGADPYRIVGLFHAARFRDATVPDKVVGDCALPLSEDVLIGADASILDFIRQADTKPCRLVVSGPRVDGLVSLSDLQKLPARAALFALITGLEITMAEAIERRFGDSDGWKSCLKPHRQQQIEKNIAASREKDAFVNEILFTQFCDKRTIILEYFNLGEVGTKLAKIERLRNKVAHANSYAASPKRARALSGTVRDILELQKMIGNAGAHERSGHNNTRRDTAEPGLKRGRGA